MENVQAADSSAGKAVDSSAVAASSGRTTPAWNSLSGQAQEDVSRLARAALQNTALFAGNAAAGTAAQGNPGADAAAGGANLLDPLTAQLTSDQLAAMLAGGGYGAAALGSLGTAGLQPADNAAAFNALLLSGGLGLNAQNLLNPALGADLSALGALVGAEGGEMEEQVAPTKQGGLSVTSNKQLSSRFRGVCWNKKNKRWQAAINSSGKYLYLGSFTNEDDAARQFDRAAIKLRGKKAKLNFEYTDYVDENGELLDEIILPQGATKEDGVRSSAGGARRGSKSTAADASGLDLAGYHPDIVNQAALAALMQQGAWQGMARSGKTAVVAQPLALEKEQVSVLLPPGCTMEYIVPVQESGASGGGSSGNGGGSRTLFGVVYKDCGSGLFGAGVWTGYMFKAFGHYASEEAAAQTARSAGELLSEDRDLRVSGGVANQQSMGLMAAPAGLIAAPGGAAFSQDALALAGLAAAGLGGRGVAGSNPAAGMAGGLFAPGLMGAGMGSLANVSLAQAAQLAQQAAAEQGLPMSYPPLSVALPVASAGLQLLPPGMPAVSGAAVGAAGDMAALGLDAASKASSEAEMQQIMQQLMAQQQQQQQPDIQRQLLMQQQQLMAGADGGDGFLKLANLDMSQLRQQLMEQQQQGLSADPSGTDVQQQEVLGSIPGLDTAAAQKRRFDETDMAAADAAAAAATAAAAAAGVDNGMGTAAVLGVQPGGEAAAGMPTGGESPSAKRIKTDTMDAAAAAAATAAAAGEAVSMPMAMAMPGAGFMAASSNMARVDLQDALKMLQTVQQQAAPTQE